MTRPLRDNPWPDDVDFPCERKLAAAVVKTAVAMWRHRGELRALWAELGGAR